MKNNLRIKKEYILFFITGLMLLAAPLAKAGENDSLQNHKGVHFKLNSFGNWLFWSYLKEEDAGLSWGLEFTSTLEIGKLEIKNIAYFEVNEYPRAIPGQPIGNGEPSTEPADGINDLLTGFWFSKRGHHAEGHHFAPGIGAQLPTADDVSLGTGKWAFGPSFDYEYSTEKLFIGAIAMQLWSVAGDPERKDVNMLLVKPFMLYNFKPKWDLMYIPYGWTVYWNKEPGQQVYFPVGGGLRRVLTFKRLDLNLSAQFFHNAIRPDKGTVNELRFLIEMAF